MELKVTYTSGVFKPIKKITGIKDGETFEIVLEKEDIHTLALASGSFDFLKSEEELYSESDLVEHY